MMYHSSGPSLDLLSVTDDPRVRQTIDQMVPRSKPTAKNLQPIYFKTKLSN